MPEKPTHFKDRSIPPKIQSNPSSFSSSATEVGPDFLRHFENCSQVSNSTVKPTCRKQETATYAWVPSGKNRDMYISPVTHPVVYFDHAWKKRMQEDVALELWAAEERLSRAPFPWTLPLHPGEVVFDILDRLGPPCGIKNATEFEPCVCMRVIEALMR